MINHINTFSVEWEPFWLLHMQDLFSTFQVNVAPLLKASSVSDILAAGNIETELAYFFPD